MISQIENIKIFGFSKFNYDYEYDLAGNLVSQICGGGNLVTGDSYYREYNGLGELKKSVMLKRMGVHPKYQRKGIGQAILDHLEGKAKLMGYTMPLLNTLKHQKKSQKFYEKNKYIRYRQGVEHGFNVLYYKKSLKINKN